MTTRTPFPALRSARGRRLTLDPAAAHERYVSSPERMLLGALR